MALGTRWYVNRRSLAGCTKTELSVAYMGPLATLSYHLEELTSLTMWLQVRLDTCNSEEVPIWYVRMLEIEFVSTNWNENSSSKIAKVTTFNPSLGIQIDF